MTVDRRSGFSLVEVVITLVVLAVGAALASGLLLESQLGLLRAQAEVLEPLPRYATARLRSDVAGAASVTAVLPGWRSSPLELTLADGSAITWRVVGESLERVARDRNGAAMVRHVALRQVSAWRWRATAPDLVDVEIAYQARDVSAAPLVEARRTWSPLVLEQSVWLRVALRAAAVP